MIVPDRQNERMDHRGNDRMSAPEVRCALVVRGWAPPQRSASLACQHERRLPALALERKAAERSDHLICTAPYRRLHG
jgi:hypothetical protein